MGSAVQVLRKKRCCAGVLSIPSDGVFRKSSRDWLGHGLHQQLFSRYSLLFWHCSQPSRWIEDTVETF